MLSEYHEYSYMKYQELHIFGGSSSLKGTIDVHDPPIVPVLQYQNDLLRLSHLNEHIQYHAYFLTGKH